MEIANKEAQSCQILACQLLVPETLTRKDRRQHVDNTIFRISNKLDSEWVDLVVLPELATIDYSRDSFDQLKQLAETLDGSSVSKMQELAQRYRSAVVFGMPRVEQGDVYISQLIINGSGELIGCYDKLHICQYGASMEKEYFQRGNHLSVFEVAGIRFAPIICYDIRLPELSRNLTINHHIDCILHCGAYFRDESFHSWHSFVATRAIENQIYLLSLNRAGTNYGNSIFCLPWMDEEKTATSFDACHEDLRYLTVYPASIREARQQYSFLSDKLDDYERLPIDEYLVIER
jgi:nitrilase